MGNEFNLTKLQTDTLREVCGIGAGHAATALSQLMNVKINMSVPQIEMVPIEKVNFLFKNQEELSVGIYLKILGEAPGSLLMIFPCKDALNLVRNVMPTGDSNKNTLTELDYSTLKEIGNIIAGSFLAVFSSLTHKPMIMSVPHLACDMAGSIIDFMLIELAQVVEQALVFEIELYDVPKNLTLKFIILPNPGSMELLLKAIGANS